MGFEKFTKPDWAFGVPPGDPYYIEPPLSKMQTGWLSEEKPPFQWFNWLHYAYRQWTYIFEDMHDLDKSVFMDSDSLCTFDSGANTLTFGDDIDIWYVQDGDLQHNTIPTADSPITITDGDAIVCILNTDTVALSNDTYGNIDEGIYSVVAIGSLAENDDFDEFVICYRLGSKLFFPAMKQVISGSRTFQLCGVQEHSHASDAEGGQLDWDSIWVDDPVHTHESNSEGGVLDHGDALSGLGDDDHTQYILVNGTRAFTGNQSMGSHKITSLATPTTDYDAATKKYVDDNTTSHSHLIDEPSASYSVYSIFSGTISSHGDKDEVFWPMSRDGTADGKCYFMGSDSDWELERLGFGTNNLRIRDGDTGAANYSVSAVFSVGGGEYYYQISGSPDISGYTTAQGAEFLHNNIMTRVAVPGGNFTGARNNVKRFRIYADVIDAADTFYLTVDAFDSNDIVIPSIIGINQYNGSFDSDNGIAFKEIYHTGGQWRCNIEVRAGTDQLRYDLQVAVIPQRTETN